MDISSILSRHCVHARLAANSRKRVLQAASDLLAEAYPALSGRALFDELMVRERLGSTGIGEGVAIPHCRLDCDAILGALISLEQPVDYESIDGQPVDLLFVLVVPREENAAHLELLAALARIFNNADTRRQLRAASSDAELYERLIGSFKAELA